MYIKYYLFFQPSTKIFIVTQSLYIFNLYSVLLFPLSLLAVFPLCSVYSLLLCLLTIYLDFSPVSTVVFYFTFHIFISFHTIIIFILFRSFYMIFLLLLSIAESIVQFLYFHLILKFFKHSSVTYSFKSNKTINPSLLSLCPTNHLSFRSSLSRHPPPPPSPFSPPCLSFCLYHAYLSLQPPCVWALQPVIGSKSPYLLPPSQPPLANRPNFRSHSLANKNVDTIIQDFRKKHSKLEEK
jgi:hypothetical protein